MTLEITPFDRSGKIATILKFFRLKYADGGARTHGHALKRRALYRLSYVGSNASYLFFSYLILAVSNYILSGFEPDSRQSGHHHIGLRRVSSVNIITNLL